jgi:hypothetical protein
MCNYCFGIKKDRSLLKNTVFAIIMKNIIYNYSAFGSSTSVVCSEVSVSACAEASSV